MKKGLALLLCVCLALTALAGCSGKTKEMQKVTVCEVTHSIFYAPQYVALALRGTKHLQRCVPVVLK